MKGLYNLLKFRQLVCEGARFSIQVIYSQREKRSKTAGQLGGEMAGAGGRTPLREGKRWGWGEKMRWETQKNSET